MQWSAHRNKTVPFFSTPSKIFHAVETCLILLYFKALCFLLVHDKENLLDALKEVQHSGKFFNFESRFSTPSSE